MSLRNSLILPLVLILGFSCSKKEVLEIANTSIDSLVFESEEIDVSSEKVMSAQPISPHIEINFSSAIIDTPDNLTEVFIIKSDDVSTVALSKSLSDDRKTLNLSAANPLDYGSTYQLIITELLLDDDSKTLLEEFSISFSTVGAPHLQIISVKIEDSDIDLSNPIIENAPENANIAITFLQSLDASSLTNIGFDKDVTATISLSNENKTLHISPNTNLRNGDTYNLTIPLDIRSSEGKTLEQPLNITILVRPLLRLHINQIKVDSRLVDLNTLSLSDVDVRPIIQITFSENIDSSSIEQITLSKNGQTIDIVKNLDDHILIISRPNNRKIDENSSYRLTIPRSVKSLNSQNLDKQISVSLNTSDAAAPIITKLEIDGVILDSDEVEADVGLSPQIEIGFLDDIKGDDNLKLITLTKDENNIVLEVSLRNSKTVIVSLPPDGQLDFDSVYILTISTSFEGSNGKRLQNEKNLRLRSDYSPPIITEITVNTNTVDIDNPNPRADSVGSNPKITVTFSKTINTGSIANIKITDNNGLSIPTTATGNETKISVQLNSGESLNFGSTYKLVIPNTIRSVEGVVLQAPFELYLEP